MCFAIREQHYDVAELLLARGADPSCTTSEGFTPITLAYSTKNNAIIRLLTGKDGNNSQCYQQQQIEDDGQTSQENTSTQVNWVFNTKDRFGVKC